MSQNVRPLVVCPSRYGRARGQGSMPSSAVHSSAPRHGCLRTLEELIVGEVVGTACGATGRGRGNPVAVHQASSPRSCGIHRASRRPKRGQVFIAAWRRKSFCKNSEITPGEAAFMKPSSTPHVRPLPALRLAMSFSSSPCPLDLTSPTHTGRA